MGMIANFMQIGQAQLDALLDDPDGIDPAIHPPEGAPPDTIDVDKAWHGIHFLLTGSPWRGAEPLVNVVLGGVEIGEDVGYGPARYLTPDQVRDVAAALSAIPSDLLGARFDPDAMIRADIYPEIWDEGDEARNYLLGAYERLRNHYLDAARRGNAMLIFID